MIFAMTTAKKKKKVIKDQGRDLVCIRRLRPPTCHTAPPSKSARVPSPVARKTLSLSLACRRLAGKRRRYSSLTNSRALASAAILPLREAAGGCDVKRSRRRRRRCSGPPWLFRRLLAPPRRNAIFREVGPKPDGEAALSQNRHTALSTCPAFGGLTA